MSTFIQKFLNLRARKLQPLEFNKVKVVYFKNRKEANNFIINICENESYVSIELTEYKTKMTGSLKRKKICDFSLATHEVIGREFDNVLIPLDKYFYYNDIGKLASSYSEFYPYSEDSCIFEALTRVRNNLLLVVIDNSQLFITIQQILTWRNDKINEL